MDELLQQGIDAVNSGKREEARVLLGALIKQSPDCEPAWGWLFKVCITDQERLDCLKQVLRINPGNAKAAHILEEYSTRVGVPAPDHKEDLLQQGIDAIHAGNFVGAHILLSDLTRKSPDSESAWMWLYQACTTDPERIHCLEQVLRINPQNEQAAGLLASLTAEVELPLEDTPEEVLKKGIDAIQAGNLAEAHALLTSLTERDPDNESAWVWLYNACTTEEERIHCLEQVLRINPHNEQAAGQLKKHTTKGGDHSEDLLHEGIDAIQAGNIEQAHALLTSLTEQSPDNESAWVWLYEACSTEQERIHCLEQILRINPQNEQAAGQLGKLTTRADVHASLTGEDLLQKGIDAIHAGKRAEAHKLLTTLTEQNPDSEPAWGWLFNVCDTNQERIHCLEQVLRINPQNEKAARLLQKFAHAVEPAQTKQPLPAPASTLSPATAPIPVPTSVLAPAAGIKGEDELFHDGLARKVTRFLLIFEVFLLAIGIGLSLAHFSQVAGWVAVVGVVLALGTPIWYYARYHTHILEEGRLDLFKQSTNRQDQILNVISQIEQIRKRREDIQPEQKAEISAALHDLQDRHTRSGLASARVDEVDIHGIGPAWKKRLVDSGFTTAASITPEVANLKGFGQARIQAILDWGELVRKQVDSTTPTELPEEILAGIDQKYAARQAEIAAEEQKAREEQAALENTNRQTRVRMDTLAAFKFGAYLRYVLGPGVGAIVLTIAILVISLVGLLASATVGTFMAAVRSLR